MKKQIVILLILSLIFTLCFGVSIAEAKTYFKSTESKLSKTIPQINSVTSTVNGMKISYKEVDKAEGYIVYKVTKSNGKNKYTKLGTTKNLYYYDTKAEYGKTYKYSVSAYYGDVKSKKSAVKSKKCTMEKGPELSGTFVFEDCIAHLKWTTVKNTEKYNIYRSTSKNSGYKKVATTKNTYYEDEIRDLGLKYYYKVKPIINNKEARYSNKFCADAVLEYPEIIADGCYEDGNGNVIISVKPQRQVVGYYVAANSDKITGAVNGVEYSNGIIKFKKPAFSCSEYLVCNLYNINGQELMGHNMFTPVSISEKPLPALNIIKAGINPAAYKLDVAWNTIPSAESYHVVLTKDGNPIYREIFDNGVSYGQIDFTNRVDGYYSVKVEAHSSRDKSESNVYSFMWKRPQQQYPNYGYDDYKPPVVNESVNNDSITENGVTCKVDRNSVLTSFTAVSGATRYMIQYIGIGNMPIVNVEVSSSGLSRYERLTTLSFAGDYYVTVVPYNGSERMNSIDGPKITIASEYGAVYPTYICGAPGCEVQVYGGDKYCHNHQCTINSCGQYKETFSFVCASHECLRVGCKYIREDNSEYCSAHKCMQPGCGKAMFEDYMFCTSHYYCSISSCLSYRQGASKYCFYHTRKYGYVEP